MGGRSVSHHGCDWRDFHAILSHFLSSLSTNITMMLRGGNVRADSARAGSSRGQGAFVRLPASCKFDRPVGCARASRAPGLRVSAVSAPEKEASGPEVIGGKERGRRALEDVACSAVRSTLPPPPLPGRPYTVHRGPEHAQVGQAPRRGAGLRLGEHVVHQGVAEGHCVSALSGGAPRALDDACMG